MPALRLKSIFVATTALTLSGLAATPSFAQDMDCGEAALGGQWIGGDADGSDVSALDTHAEQMALVLNGNAYVGLFSIGEATDVRIEAAGRGAGDPTMTLLDSTGAEVASDDDSGGNGASRIETALEPGTYCAVVRSYDDSPMTAFVRVGRPEMEALTTGMNDADDGMIDDGGSDASPEDIVAGCASGRDLGVFTTDALTYTDSADAAPYARFSVTEPRAVSLTATNSNADPVLTLRDMNGNEIAANDDFDGLDSRIDQTMPLETGEYCIGLDAISDTTLPIDVAVLAYDPAAALAALYDRGEASPPLDGSVDITDLGDLSGRLRQDVEATGTAKWFSVTLDTPGLLLVEAIAIGTDDDPWLAMYDDLGREVAFNDDTPPGTNAQIAERTQPGTYLIALKQVGDRAGIVRLVMERFAPVP
ncbi:hypothetical protein SAMN04488003_102152 [Loktanella fryxellensis]|uniref:Pre-peptidase C-terminal domain-containing protein n=1 Tax=Loktanella fryxellensis TaxID=245187 RepID=A0A1H7ZV83_9RHOB|nr:DVUA0089 family protein [Loktanella fryxellensis]SEM62350.1 hypothetical protein SAMN04488003_102152 [Loktanella fryxellensis]